MACSTTIVVTMVIGPVGPMIWVFVPPKSDTKMPIAMAAFMPPRLLIKIAPPKARAKGSATIPAVSPPDISPSN